MLTGFCTYDKGAVSLETTKTMNLDTFGSQFGHCGLEIRWFGTTKNSVVIILVDIDFAIVGPI